MEVVAREHDLPARRDPAADADLQRLVEQRELDAPHLLRVVREDALQAVAGKVAAHRRVEHLAQPVEEDRAVELVHDRRVDLDVRRLAGARLRQPRHGQQHGNAAETADERRLIRDRVDQRRVAAGRGGLVAAGARDEPVAEFERRAELDQPPRARPADLEALGRVHRFRHAEAERVDPPAQAGGRLPVDPLRDLLRRAGPVHRVAGVGVVAAHDDVKRRVAEPRQERRYGHEAPPSAPAAGSVDPSAAEPRTDRPDDADSGPPSLRFLSADRLISLIRANSGVCR